MSTRKAKKTIDGSAPAQAKAFGQIATHAYLEADSMKQVANYMLAAGLKAISKDAPERIKTRQTAIRMEYVVGTMAFLLKECSNMEQGEAFARARQVLTNLGPWHDPAKGSAPKLQAKFKGRRSQAQEQAYAAARKRLQRVLEYTGVATIAKTGGARKARPKAPEKAPSKLATGAEADTIRSEATTYKTQVDVTVAVNERAQALLAFIDAHALLTSNATKSAVQDFCEAMRAIADATNGSAKIVDRMKRLARNADAPVVPVEAA